MGWKSDKDGNHFNNKKRERDVSDSGTEVNIEIDNNSDDFAEEVKQGFDNSLGTLISGSEKNMWESRFREAKRQNHGYEQIMESLREHIKEGKLRNDDVSYYENLQDKIRDAERNRPHKAFDYHWITRSVEEIIEDNPQITESSLRREAKDIHSDVTDKRIDDAIEHLERNGVIVRSNGKFNYIGDYINN